MVSDYHATTIADRFQRDNFLRINIVFDFFSYKNNRNIHKTHVVLVTVRRMTREADRDNIIILIIADYIIE